MKRRILVVAEDASLRAMLARALLQAGQAVELAEGARRAREVIAQDDVALAIVAPHGMGAAGVALAIEIKRQVHLASAVYNSRIHKLPTCDSLLLCG